MPKIAFKTNSLLSLFKLFHLLSRWTEVTQTSHKHIPYTALVHLRGKWEQLLVGVQKLTTGVIIYRFNLPSTQAPGTPTTLQTCTNSKPALSNKPLNPASVLSFPPIAKTH